MVVLNKYTIEEVLKHNTRPDAWLVIDDWVIDVTHFFTLHPGGADVLMEHIGKDASEVFRNADVHLHGKAALHLMNKFLIGYIDGKKKLPKKLSEDLCVKKLRKIMG